MKKIYFPFFILLILSGFSFSQEYTDVLRPFNGFKASQGMATAIGNATVAAGQVIPNIGSNPANLGLHRFKIFQLGFTSSDFTGNASTLPQTGMSGIQFIFPFPVYQGSLVTGFGYTRDSEFSLSYKDNESELREQGALNSLHFSIATELFKNVFIGGDMKWILGYNEMIETYLDGSGQDVFQPSYKGIGTTLGILQRLTPHINWGVSVDLPTILWVDDELTETYNGSTYNDNIEYRIMKSSTFRTGISVFLKNLNIFYEMEWNNWQNMSISSNIENADGSEADIDINIDIEQQLQNTLSHKIGGAFHVPFIPLHIYSGYQYLPQADKGNTKQSISFGLTYLVQQSMSLNMTYQNYYWDYGREQENWSQTAFSLMLHF